MSPPPSPDRDAQPAHTHTPPYSVRRRAPQTHSPTMWCVWRGNTQSGRRAPPAGPRAPSVEGAVPLPGGDAEAGKGGTGAAAGGEAATRPGRCIWNPHFASEVSNNFGFRQLHAAPPAPLVAPLRLPPQPHAARPHNPTSHQHHQQHRQQHQQGAHAAGVAASAGSGGVGNSRAMVGDKSAAVCSVARGAQLGAAVAATAVLAALIDLNHTFAYVHSRGNGTAQTCFCTGDRERGLFVLGQNQGRLLGLLNRLWPGRTGTDGGAVFPRSEFFASLQDMPPDPYVLGTLCGRSTGSRDASACRRRQGKLFRVLNSARPLLSPAARAAEHAVPFPSWSWDWPGW
eukprot:gene41934-22944_t